MCRQVEKDKTADAAESKKKSGGGGKVRGKKDAVKGTAVSFRGKVGVIITNPDSGAGHPTPQHGLSSDKMALITSDCGEM